MDIVQERLEREYDMDLITTAPTVVYEVVMRDGTVEQDREPGQAADPSKIEEIREPIITATIFVPQEYVGAVITLCTGKRGMQKNMQYSARQVVLTYELPLNEVVMDFFDKLKSVSRGYALARLRVQGIPRRRPGEARHPDQRRAGRRAVAHRAPRERAATAAASWWRRCAS